MKAAYRRFTVVVVVLMSCWPAVADDATDVRSVVTQFETALQKHDIEAVGRLVSPDIVVFENGYRNDGWADFRDHHLVPEFKAASTTYTTEIVRVDATPTMGWAYSEMTRNLPGPTRKRPDVWTSYVLRKQKSRMEDRPTELECASYGE